MSAFKIKIFFFHVFCGLCPHFPGFILKIYKNSRLSFSQSRVDKVRSWLRTLPFIVKRLFPVRQGERIYRENPGLQMSLTRGPSQGNKLKKNIFDRNDLQAECF